MSGGWHPGLSHLPAQAFVDDGKTALQDGAVVLMVRLVRMALGEEGLEPVLRMAVDCGQLLRREIRVNH